MSTLKETQDKAFTWMEETVRKNPNGLMPPLGEYNLHDRTAPFPGEFPGTDEEDDDDPPANDNPKTPGA